MTVLQKLIRTILSLVSEYKVMQQTILERMIVTVKSKSDWTRPRFLDTCS